MTSPVNLQNVQRIVADLGELAAHDVPIGALPTKVENVSSAMRWMWGMLEAAPQDLKVARRIHAQKYHPDIIGEQATGALAAVNAAIDEGIRESAA
jgi:hypothetical protein